MALHEAPESWRAWLIRRALLPASGIKSILSRPARFRRLASFDRHRRALGPPRRLRRHGILAAERDGPHLLLNLTPHGPPSDRAIVYVPGGALALRVMGHHWRIATGLMQRTGARLTVFGYAPAPEHGGDEALEALCRLMDRHSGTFVLAGDSSGAGLALAAAMRQRDRGGRTPLRIALFSPWLDLSLSTVGQAQDRCDPMLGVAGPLWAARRWAAGRSLRDPALSPLFGDLCGLPPVAAYAGTCDLAVADAKRLAERPVSGGMTLTLYPRMVHGWVGFPTPEARHALDGAAAFLFP